MKPLLRAVLTVDALVTAAFALLLVATPWGALYGALQLIQVSPAMAGQLFGVALLALAWLQLRSAIHGALTVPVASASGHALWVSGVLILIWLIAVRSPSLAGLGVWIGPLVGVALLLDGLLNVRLASAVRRRERAAAQGAASAARAERRAAEEPVRTVATTPLEAGAPVTGAGAVGGAARAPGDPCADVTSSPVNPYERREPIVSADDKPNTRG